VRLEIAVSADLAASTKLTVGLISAVHADSSAAAVLAAIFVTAVWAECAAIAVPTLILVFAVWAFFTIFSHVECVFNNRCGFYTM